MRNVALAMVGYDGRNGKYPGYMNVLITQQGNAYKDPTTQTLTPVSWAVELLSDLDRGALYEQWRMDISSSGGGGGGSSGGSSGYIANTKIYMEILTCPSDDANRQGTPLSYCVNTGRQDLQQATASTTGSSSGGSGGSTTVGMPRDWQANGMFFDNYSEDKLIKTSSTARGPMVVMRSGQVRDAKDKTIMITENVDSGDYTFDSSLTGDTTFKTTEVQIGCVYDVGATPAGAVTNQTATPPTLTPTVPGYRPNVDLGKGDSSYTNYQYCRPSSRHPQGINVAFVGTNVTFVRDTISYFIFAKLMASDDAAMKSPGLQTLLDPALRLYQVNDQDINP